MRLFFEQLAASYEITKFDPREFISSGDHVVAPVTIAGRVRATGVAAAEDMAHVFRIRNGKVSEFREYADARSIVAAYAPQAAERSTMSSDEYRFTTRWRVRGTCERVSDVLADTDRIASWWPSVYRECTVLERGGQHGLGRRVAVTTKGFLPYAIHWRFTVVEEFYPHGSRIVAEGDLEGEGRWTLTQDGDEVAISYDWRVRANKPLLRRFGRWLRPLFAANHDYTMRQGLHGLRAELAGRQCASVAQRNTTG